MVGVGGSQQPGAHVEPFTRHAAVVARTVGTFVVSGGAISERDEQRAAAQRGRSDTGADERAFHCSALSGPGRSQIPFGTPTSDVVHQGGPTEHCAIRIGPARRRSGGDHQFGDTGRVATQPRRLDVGEVGHRRQRRIEPGIVDAHHRFRLSVQDHRAGVVGALGQPALTTVDDDVDHGRVVTVPASMSEYLNRGRPSGLTCPNSASRATETMRTATGTSSPAKPAG